MKNSYSKCYIILQSRGFLRPRDILNTLYLNLHQTNGHQTWKVVTLHEGLSLINSHNLLDMCSREITWQIKNTISPLSQCLCSHDLPVWWHILRSSHPYISITSQRGGHVGSRYKLNTLYLHLQGTYRHQTRQGAVLLKKTCTNLSHITLWLYDQRKVVWQFEKFIFPLSQNLWLLNLGANLREQIHHANA